MDEGQLANVDSEPTIRTMSLSFFQVQRLAACFGEGAFGVGDIFLAMVATIATDRMHPTIVVQLKLRRRVRW
jgi:hypothetical protein